MKLALFCVSVLAALVIQETTATDYCNASLCGGAKHIGCNNSGALSKACFADAKIIPVTVAVRDAILKRHNVLRNKIAKGDFSVYKPAIRMATMQWAPELAALAALNVKQCAMVHDACRNTDRFHNAGQNLALTIWSGQTREVQEVAVGQVQAFFDEQKDASMAYINKYSIPTNGKVIGHFTQMINARNTHVGCSILKQSQGKDTYQYMACNYAYTNFFDKPTYISGPKPATKCTTGTHPTYPYLCSLKEQFAVNSV